MKFLRGRRKQRAAAAVEMAVVTPVLLTMLFGIIEFGWMLTVKHSLVNAAREGARVGVLQGTDATDVQAALNEYLEPLNLPGSLSVYIQDATVDDPTVLVRLSVPWQDVSLVGDYFGVSTGSLEAECAMRKEGM